MIKKTKRFVIQSSSISDKTDIPKRGTYLHEYYLIDKGHPVPASDRYLYYNEARRKQGPQQVVTNRSTLLNRGWTFDYRPIPIFLDDRTVAERDEVILQTKMQQGKKNIIPLPSARNPTPRKK
tara:strand:+ start:2600 stop:2968 length:369 start_codon:yes stop_codon:yes gene_type:complete